MQQSTRGKVFVAMSGGVDSSVAALLLQRQGYEVVGVTFKLLANVADETEPDRPCCSLESVEQARAVCRTLGLPHYTMSFVEQFEREVIARFVDEYVQGRTPNPCVLCNRHLKFDGFWRKALAIGADYIATGHHARVDCVDGPLYRLLPGGDPAKDQSYALAHLNQTTLPRVLFPVGEYTKPQVRQLAAAAGLPTATVAESQDLCFVREGSYRDFLATRTALSCPGPIVTRTGRVLGEHRGLERYTVGQRKNLQISVGQRLYVIEKRRADNALVVGEPGEVCRDRVVVEDVNWCDLPAGQWPRETLSLQARAMLRYRQQPLPCGVETADETTRTVTVRLREPAVAAPGQLLVLYAETDGRVLMGGTICETTVAD